MKKMKMKFLIFLLFTCGVSSAQNVSTQHSNVKIYSGMNTTYRDLGNKTVGGVSVGTGSSNSNSHAVRVVGGNTSTTFINPKATINAVPESTGKVNVSGRLNYNSAEVQKAWKNKVGSGVPKGMGKLGWLGVLESTLGAHSEACKNGNIDFVCWGSLAPQEIVPDYSSDVDRCSLEKDTLCYFDSNNNTISYFSYDSVVDEEALARSFGAIASGFDRNCAANNNIGCNGNGANVYYPAKNGTPNLYSWLRCNGKNGYCEEWSAYASYIDKEQVHIFCSLDSSCDSRIEYYETFVPFTPKDLDGVDLPMDSMSDADFALVQDDLNVESVTLDPINTFTANNVVTSYDRDGNLIKTETITKSEFDIKNNGTSSTSVDTTTTTTTNTYDKDGNKTSSTSTTNTIKGDTNITNNYNSEYEKSDLTCNGSNCTGQGIITPTNTGQISSSSELYKPKNDQELSDFILSSTPSVDNSQFANELNQLVPNLPTGSCPVWTIAGLSVMDTVIMNPTTVDIPCWIYELIGIFMMIMAVVYSRTIIMGA